MRHICTRMAIPSENHVFILQTNFWALAAWLFFLNGIFNKYYVALFFWTGNQIMFSVNESQFYRPGYDPFLGGCLNLLSWWKTKFQMFLKYFLSEGNPISGSGSSVWLLEDAHCGTKFQFNFAQLHQNIRYGGKLHCHTQSVQDKWQKFSKVDMKTISPAEYVSVSLLQNLPW